VAAVVVAAIGAGFLVQRIFRGSGLGSAGLTTAATTPSEPPSPAPAARPTFDPTSAERYERVKGSVERGQRLLARGDFRGAASLLADAARLVPEDPRIANAYGRALLGMGSRDRALHQFERAARLDTGVAAYRVDYARALAQAGRVHEAAREYEAVSALEPGNVAASEGLLRLQQNPASDAGSTGVDLGGASSGAAPAPASGGAFTNEDLRRGARPMRPPTPISSPSPRPLAPSPRPPSPSPSPYTGPFAPPSPD
jgi:tetratricopeptide repeat protein